MGKDQDYSRYIFYLLLAAVVVLIGYMIRHTLSCLLLSVVFAYFADPFVTLLEKRGLRRAYGIGLAYLATVVFFVVLGQFLVPVVAENWATILKELPKNIANTRTYFANMKLLSSIGGPQNFDWLSDLAGADELGHKLGVFAQEAASGVLLNAVNVVLSPLVIFFLLMYKEDILTALTLLLPRSIQEHAVSIRHEIHQSIGQYVRNQVFISFFVAVASICILFYFDVDYPVLNGLFAGAVSVLPFIGIIIASVPAMFLAFIKHQSFVSALNVFAAYGAVYFIEGKIVKPVIFKGTMDIHPLITILSVMIFGELLGVWGFVLALPLVALIQIIIKYMVSVRCDTASPG